MRNLLGSDESQRLIDSLKRRAPRSVRYNLLQTSPGYRDGTIVPWCQPAGRYWNRNFLPSRRLEYVAGHYYIQEASAMLAAHAAGLVQKMEGLRILDMTAAPGGKTTQIAEMAKGGLVVANEVIRSRWAPLEWNVIRHRVENVVTLSVKTEWLAEAFPGWFDVVLVDAPCSGEGLVAKGKHSLERWSLNNVHFNASRQSKILEHASRLLKPGGLLVYSTCTFNTEENELQIEELLQKDFEPVTIPDLPVSPAIHDSEAVQRCCRRIFPHREEGAGAFCALLRKGDPAPQGEVRWRRMSVDTSGIADWQTFVQPEADQYVIRKGDMIRVFSMPELPEPLTRIPCGAGLPVLQSGKLAQWLHGAAGMARPDRIVELDEPQAFAFARGEELKNGPGEGVWFAGYRDLVLGLMLGTRARNGLPKPLRMQGSSPSSKGGD